MWRAHSAVDAGLDASTDATLQQKESDRHNAG
jgi:hypothetical protein